MHIVGVDGGTTKTIALVADHQGNILASLRGKPALLAEQLPNHPGFSRDELLAANQIWIDWA